MDETTPVSFRIRIEGRPLEANFQVPAGKAPVDRLLPIFQQFTNQVVDQSVEADAKPVSCRKGCGACCRQPVPVSDSEARMLARTVEEMPEPRRSAVRERFAKAVETLSEFRDARQRTGSLRDLGLAYFHAKVACPFLEDESCGIHPTRPLACREYLVTSPAENCWRPSAEGVKTVPLGARPSHALTRIEGEKPKWMLLTFALEWAASHSGEQTREQTGPEWMREFLERMRD